MPLIVIQRMHGSTDAPMGYALLSELDRRGVLDRVSVQLDPFMDPAFVEQMHQRFPQLVPPDALPIGVRWLPQLRAMTRGRGYKYLANLNRADAVIEAPGGRLNPIYTGNVNLFWMYPKVKRRAIAFHSLERGILDQPVTANSVATCELIISRTSESATVARQTGTVGRVVLASDIALNLEPISPVDRAGIACALRVPNRDASENYLQRTRAILDYLQDQPLPVEHVRIEHPLGQEMVRQNYANPAASKVRMFWGDLMYHPFTARRDAVISCRLHTTLVSLLHGNRKILQFHVESGTSKLQQFVDDLGIDALPVLGPDEVNVDRVREFLASDVSVPQVQVDTAIKQARQKNEAGLDALQEWIESI